MSSASEHPFIFSLDAIENIRTIMAEFSDARFEANDTPEHERFLPEIHIPLQLITCACMSQASKSQDSPAAVPHDLDTILHANKATHLVTPSGDVAFTINSHRPYATLVTDTDHDIRQDPTLFGPNFIPLQLLLAHAVRLSLSSKHFPSTPNKQQVVDMRENVIIVSRDPMTITAAIAGGFSVWNYSTKNADLFAITPLSLLLMEHKLVKVEPSGLTKPPFKPIRYKPENEPSSSTLPGEAKPG